MRKAAVTIAITASVFLLPATDAMASSQAAPAVQPQVSAPVAADSNKDDVDDHGGYGLWGLAGLLGLAGLIPRKRKEEHPPRHGRTTGSHDPNRP
ncbi:LPXTG cell wall anchor domain-containing protein [Streptomyces pactum]|uniref:LPXTG cell wall anchor domain-containing protein n=1 Tax=Streptomyces pactum TaxID=68249 RepID=A0ABS0NMH3_9ACTN|nr:WGxxGxxG family protein [Streptomyces pactum]MBH5336390.1 LPXTG cell wall anchor domain-containing protein [Streptomyces pactum]